MRASVTWSTTTKATQAASAPSVKRVSNPPQPVCSVSTSNTAHAATIVSTAFARLNVWIRHALRRRIHDGT